MYLLHTSIFSTFRNFVLSVNDSRHHLIWTFCCWVKNKVYIVCPLWALLWILSVLFQHAKYTSFFTEAYWRLGNHVFSGLWVVGDFGRGNFSGLLNSVFTTKIRCICISSALYLQVLVINLLARWSCWEFSRKWCQPYEDHIQGTSIWIQFLPLISTCLRYWWRKLEPYHNNIASIKFYFIFRIVG